MPHSLIGNVDRRTGRLVAAAPDRGVLLTSRTLGWRGIAAELHRIAPEHQSEHLVQTHRLMIHVGAPARFEFREDGGTWHARTLRPGDLSLLANSLPNEPRWHDTMEFIAIGLDPTFVEASFGDALPHARVSFRPVRGESDEAAMTFANLIRHELADATFVGTLFGDTLALGLSRYLLGRYGLGVHEPRGALTGIQLGRVVDYVYANLAEDVGLEALAGQAYVSPFHFARLFRNATGLSPHQFVLRLRVNHAQRLMRSRQGRTLTEIAVAAGFFDQAHFTKTFKRLVGITPSAFAAL